MESPSTLRSQRYATSPVQTAGRAIASGTKPSTPERGPKRRSRHSHARESLPGQRDRRYSNGSVNSVTKMFAASALTSLGSDGSITLPPKHPAMLITSSSSVRFTPEASDTPPLSPGHSSHGERRHSLSPFSAAKAPIFLGTSDLSEHLVSPTARHATGFGARSRRASHPLVERVRGGPVQTQWPSADRLDFCRSRVSAPKTCKLQSPSPRNMRCIEYGDEADSNKPTPRGLLTSRSSGSCDDSEDCKTRE